jgi:membrane associated rhomboid family serine protease
MDESRRPPATLALSALWVLVFLAMQLWQGTFTLAANPFNLGILQTQTTHLFGDATSADLASGQVWRALTSTFIHFSILHLVVNVSSLIPLGMIIESWYGWAHFMVIYVLIGTLGNLLAGAARPLFGVASYVHCGGGSTVIFGLIALCAVVGLRSPLKEGRELGRLMLGILLFNYALGFGFWAASRWMGWQLPSFDHLAHASGTLLGALLGFGHGILKRTRDTRPGRWAGILAALTIVAAFGLQLRASRAEIAATHERTMVVGRWTQARAFVANLMRLDLIYHLAYHRGQGREFIIERRQQPVVGLPASDTVVVPETAEIDRGLRATLEALPRARPPSWPVETARAYNRLRALASQALERPPSRLQLQEFEARFKTVFPMASEDLRTAENQLVALARREAGGR